MNKKSVIIKLGIVIGIIILIFITSSMTGDESHNIADGVVNSILENKVESNSLEEVIDDITYNEYFESYKVIFRKFSHAIIYAILAIALMILFNKNNIGIMNKVINILFIVILIATVDEFYQLYVPGRHSQVKDIIIDFMGGGIGIIVTLIVIRMKNINRKIRIK